MNATYIYIFLRILNNTASTWIFKGVHSSQQCGKNFLHNPIHFNGLKLLNPINMSSFFSSILNLSLCIPPATVCISGLTAIIVYANNCMARNSSPKLTGFINRYKIKCAFAQTHREIFSNYKQPGSSRTWFYCPGCFIVHGWDF